jgi:hypothetical protein
LTGKRKRLAGSQESDGGVMTVTTVVRDEDGVVGMAELCLKSDEEVVARKIRVTRRRTVASGEDPVAGGRR